MLSRLSDHKIGTWLVALGKGMDIKLMIKKGVMSDLKGMSKEWFCS